MMPTSEMPKIRLFEMRCETHTVSLANSLLMIMASNYLLLILMKNSYLYKNKALNYYNGCRIFVLDCEDFDWEQTADRLKYFKSKILELNIQEDHEHWDESQDLLNQIEMDIDYADDQF